MRWQTMLVILLQSVGCVSLPIDDYTAPGGGTANFKKLLDHRIVDLDAVTVGEYPVEYAGLRGCILVLPQCNSDPEYTLSPLQSYVD